MAPLAPAPLAHAIVRPTSGEASGYLLFLHGILGTGANWRTLARRVIDARPGFGAVLVDLRMHGRSQHFAPPHTVAAAAADLVALEAVLPGKVRGVVGHSFGGKVALAYVEAKGGALDDAWIVDSTPGARPDARGSEATAFIVGLLETLPRTFAERDAFGRALRENGVHEDMIAWLAMNVERDDERGGYRLRTDVAAIRALLEDYFLRDLWSVVEAPPGDVRVHVVVGGRSPVFDEADRQRAARAAEAHPGRVSFDVIEEAGHWVHVDAPGPLLELLSQGGPPRAT